MGPPANQTTGADTPQGFQVRRETYGDDFTDDYEEGTITGYAVRSLTCLLGV